MREPIIPAVAAMLLLAGCAGQGTAAQSPAPAPVESVAPAAPSPTETLAVRSTRPPEADPLFSALPDVFTLSSGAGGWGTELILEDDGSFHGSYRDSDMGVRGENYPYGTVSRCSFRGKFAPPVQVDAYTWSTHVEELELDAVPGTVTFEGASGISTRSPMA